MRKLVLAASVAAIAASTSAMAQDSEIMQIGGEIIEYCVLDLNVLPGATTLDLSVGAPYQHIADVGVWCNNGVGFATVTYTSFGAGLTDELGNLIAYNAQLDAGLSGGPVNIPFDGTDHAFQQIAGDDGAGTFTYSALEVQPLASGFEPAGYYEDVIEISVVP